MKVVGGEVTSAAALAPKCAPMGLQGTVGHAWGGVGDPQGPWRGFLGGLGAI